MSSAETEAVVAVSTTAAPTQEESPPAAVETAVEKTVEVTTSEKIPGDSHDEEYESADDAYEDEDDEDGEAEEEYEERSPSQLEKEKELDDDEDRKNPQFIPKKGYFYEHDDRTRLTDDEEPAEEAKEEGKEVGKVVVKEKWSHDMYNEDEQTPKSHEELNRAYGYDIRTEDVAPRARRRRRYGRGPNKYTRQWEDEEAYQKPPRGGARGAEGPTFRGARGGRGGRGRGASNNRRNDGGYEEDFPELPGAPKIGAKTPKSQEPMQEKTEEKQQPQNQPPPRERDDRRRFSSEGYPGEREGFRGGRGGRGQRSRGGGERGGGGGRGRNEFTNRNRYATNNERNHVETREQQPPRDNRDHQTTQVQQQRSPRGHGGQGGHDRGQQEARSKVSGGGGVSNGHMGGGSKRGPASTKPPFSTTTEYTGSDSLTAKVNHDNNGDTSTATATSKPGVRDLREVLNAKRERERQQGQQGQQGGRQQQMAPRHQNPTHAEQLHPHHPQLLQQTQTQTSGGGGSKPKRFSTQRQRQGEGHEMLGAAPVVTEGIIPSPVPPAVVAYAQQPQPTYYDPTQVYESSPVVTVATVANGGPSVSPSLWAASHHGYATGPGGGPPGPYHHGGGEGHPYLTSVAPPPPGSQGGMYGGVQAPPPQFLADPATLLNYGGPPAQSFVPPPYHPQGYQTYPQVAPAPPEVYHGGVTYYSPQTQLQRQPMVALQKRPKSVLQLVEPPEKAKAQIPPQVVQYHVSHPQQPPHEDQLATQVENINLNTEERRPSPCPPPQESWSAQMEEVSSPTEASPPEKQSTFRAKAKAPSPTQEKVSTNSTSSKSPPPVTTTAEEAK